MKKALAAVAVLAFVIICGLAYAAAPASGTGSQVDVNVLRQFQKETLPLRDEMQVKRLELGNEYAKETPDQNRIAQIEKEMIDLRTKIRTAAEKSGLQGWGRGYGQRGHGRMAGFGNCGGYGDRGPRMMGHAADFGNCGGPGCGGNRGAW